MIRVEIVLKNHWGSSIAGSAIERRLKSEIVEAVMERAKLDDLEISRVQFLAPAPKRRS